MNFADSGKDAEPLPVRGRKSLGHWDIRRSKAALSRFSRPPEQENDDGRDKLRKLTASESVHIKTTAHIISGRLGRAGGGKQHLRGTGVRRVGRAGITCGADGEGRAEWTRDHHAPTPAIRMNFPVYKELHTHFLLLPPTRPRRQWGKGLVCPLQLF